MKQASQYRALASLCRQQAAYNPAQGWHLLSQAERWEHLADTCLANHFRECNVAEPANTAPLVLADETPWKTIAA